MAFLVVAGITVPVETFTESAPITGGSVSNSYAGPTRSTIRWVRRVYTAVTTLMLTADVETLRTAVISGSPVTCSGTALPASGSYIVSVADSPSTAAEGSDGNHFMRTITLTLRQV
jgi:hypothetical protein